MFLATAVSLDLATLAWGGGGAVPDLPAPPCIGFSTTPRERFSLGQLPGARLVAAGGTYQGPATAAFEWAPGRAAWTPLPSGGTAPRVAAAAVTLSDGRMLVAGGFGVGVALPSVEVLAADGSGWAALPPMVAAQYGAAAGRLPGGQVIVVGGVNS
jgi:hypothetical protein